MKKQLISMVTALSLLTACGGNPKTTAEADRKEPTAEEASVKRLYESVNWRSLAAQAAVVAVPAVAAAIYSHRRNIKLF